MSLQVIPSSPLISNEKMSLDAILETLDGHDLGVLKLTEAEQKVLTERLFQKVDACRVRYDEWTDEIARLKKYEEEYKKARAAIENKQKRFKDRIVYSMREKEFTALEGNRFKICLRSGKSAVNVEPPHPTQLQAEKFRDITRTKITYEWDKDAIKAKIEAGFSYSFAQLRETHFVTFGVKKGFSDDDFSSDYDGK